MQKIFFGPPGCGKSFHVRQVAINDLGIAKIPEALKNNPNMIEATFHPEYGYGDFVAKLLPKTKPEGGIEYLTHAGPLIKALARAYADLDQPVLLVIDEINRGNCAQIFGDIFQLLDRRDDGWSEYGVDPSDLIMDALKQEMGEGCLLPELVQVKAKDKDSKEIVSGYKLRLPPNLSLVGTMNTSDESVYYMDTAFKRRWDFEYMPCQRKENAPDTPDTHKLKAQETAKIENSLFKNEQIVWGVFLRKLNKFISHKFEERNVDDKQVGIWFLKALNLPQLTTRTEAVEKRIVFSEKLATLLTNLATLCNNPKQEDWVTHFPSATIFPEENVKGKKKHGYLKCDSIKNTLENEYKINCVNFEFKIDATYLAQNLIKYIISGNLATFIEPDEVGCLGEIEKEVTSVEPVITLDAIKNKLMFFLWDNVFSRNRKPLFEELLKKVDPSTKEPRTFGDFAGNVDGFIQGVMAWNEPPDVQKPVAAQTLD